MFPHKREDAVFWQLIVTGWGGIAPPESGIQEVPDPFGDRRVYGPCTNPDALFDPDQWDGSDFFVVWPLPNYWWISAKARKLLQQRKLKRFKLVPAAELRLSESVDHVTFGPGRLRDYFTDERAREIGEPLGIY